MLPLGTQMRGESVQIKLPCVPGENSFIVLFLRFNFTFAGGHPHQQNSITDTSLQPPHPQGVIMIVQSNFQNANIFRSDLF